MKDILLDDQNEPVISNGDFVIGESNEQHIRLVALSNKGEFKRNPEVGANLSDLLSDDSPKKAATELKRQLEYDGAKVESIKVSEGNISIDANYQD